MKFEEITPNRSYYHHRPRKASGRKGGRIFTTYKYFVTAVNQDIKEVQATLDGAPPAWYKRGTYAMWTRDDKTPPPEDYKPRRIIIE